ncbi:MAG: ATP-dependent DNA helicase [Gammaproteobacteria bacterium]|nr:ATP-dependent DNA helicase [Gammaproteobacteria bacterium]MDH5594096.1 ATP-dependent DNA helicase [Gammaproteobacteria bacterium]
MQTPTEILSTEGPLAARISGFAVRSQQQEMAESILSVLLDGKKLVAEAGTGTGKTFAYLVPALLSGKKVIISTGTKTLQDQLFQKDLPVVRNALSVPITTALLKGRSNYLCTYRLHQIAPQHKLSRHDTDALQKAKEWSSYTKSGDIAELNNLPEDSGIWNLITSTAENCLGSECEDYNKCYLVNARRQAQEADVLVVNHHLLFSDMALREEGFGEVLPGANAFILDEAHLIPELASVFFGVSLSSRQLTELSKDTIAAQINSAGDTPELRKAAETFEKKVRDMRLAMGKDIRRSSWQALKEKKINSAIKVVSESLQLLINHLNLASERSKELDACAKRAELLQDRFRKITDNNESDYIHWFETFKNSFVLYMTPLNVANIFQERIAQYRSAWIFTSATLAVGDSFDHYTDHLGLHDAETRQWQSPFDFEHQALLYIPKNLPDPNDTGYIDSVIDAAIPVIEACGGRTFFLFTSYRALNRAKAVLQEEIDYPLLVQGSMPHAELLESFRKTGNAVLLGTSSFWEGVDVRGEALSCVIIDKLPFAPPDDPVLQARIDIMRRNGGNPFMEYQLPNAAITLKQGAGRLIRDVNDTGVMMLCDPRILGKPYGKVFLRSLPSMPLTRELADVEYFFDNQYTDKADLEEELDFV